MSASTDPKTPKERRQESRELDEELEDTFPASDPPAIIQPHRDEDKPGNGSGRR